MAAEITTWSGANWRRTARARSPVSSATRCTASASGLRSKSDLLVVVLGDHPLVVGEGALEDAADQLAPAEAEGQVVLAAAVGELAVPLEALQLLEGLARDQDRVLVRRAALQPALDQRQAVAVGRHHLQRAVLELQQGAVELEARLLGRDGEEDLGDHAAELGERDVDPAAVLDGGQGREVVRRRGRGS